MTRPRFHHILIAVATAICANAQESVVLFDAERTVGAHAELLNASMTTLEKRGGHAIATIERGTDAYAPVEWRFQFTSPFLKDWDEITLEITYFDEGAGVLQPLLLRDDAFSGAWSPPARRVSFSRLNTGTVRRALFLFSNPGVDWAEATNAHLKIVGLQFLMSIRAFPRVPDSRWAARAKRVPVRVEPMVQLKRPMQITCTVGIPDTGNPPPMDAALENIREYAPLARLLGFTSVECFVRWDLIEPRKGEFDFSHYDRIVDAIQERGLKWYPNLVITSGFALPKWYVESGEHTGMRCLEHGEANDVPSIWNPNAREHVERVMRAFGNHYEPTGMLEAVRLGPSGNFGEAQYPAGAGAALGYQGARMHAHIGWWAGDSYANSDFDAFLQTRYTAVDALNTAWDTRATAFGEIAPQLPETSRTRRARLDMTEWYTDSMTDWCAFWAKTARAAMPTTPIYLSSGGWGYREAGTDFSSQSAAMKKHGCGIRLTNETDSFEQNVYATRLAATAARLYNIPLGYEPAGYHSARGTVGRFFSTVTTNGDNLYTRHSVLFENDYSVENWLREYALLDQRDDPLVDVAVYYPETMNQLDDGAFRQLYAWGFNPRAAEIRRRIDIDFLDERLIRDGFLDRYKVLVFCWGNVIEPDVQRAIDAWIRNGGIAIYPTYPRGPQETVEGDQTVFVSWERGNTGKGAFHRFQGDMEPLTLYGNFVERIVRDTPSLHRWTRVALELKRPVRTFVSVLQTGKLVMLNYNDAPSLIELPGQFSETLPPYSTRIVSLIP